MVENKITSTRPYKSCPPPSPSTVVRTQQMRQIAAAFPVGTIVQSGPFVEECEPEFYEVIAYDERVDATARRADDSIEAVSWSKDLGGGHDYGAFFVACRLLKTPFVHNKIGRTTRQPPATLTPINGPVPQIAPVEGLEAALDAALDRNKRLEDKVTRLQDTIRRYTKQIADERVKSNAAYSRGEQYGRQMERERLQRKFADVRDYLNVDVDA